jgi:hypothetical protein
VPTGTVLICTLPVNLARLSLTDFFFFLVRVFCRSDLVRLAAPDGAETDEEADALGILGVLGQVHQTISTPTPNAVKHLEEIPNPLILNMRCFKQN